MDVTQLGLGLIAGVMAGSVIVAAFVIPTKLADIATKLADIASALYAISRQLDKLDRDRQP